MSPTTSPFLSPHRSCSAPENIGFRCRPTRSFLPPVSGVGRIGPSSTTFPRPGRTLAAASVYAKPGTCGRFVVGDPAAGDQVFPLGRHEQPIHSASDLRLGCARPLEIFATTCRCRPTARGLPVTACMPMWSVRIQLPGWKRYYSDSALRSRCQCLDCAGTSARCENDGFGSVCPGQQQAVCIWRGNHPAEVRFSAPRSFTILPATPGRPEHPCPMCAPSWAQVTTTAKFTWSAVTAPDSVPLRMPRPGNTMSGQYVGDQGKHARGVGRGGIGGGRWALVCHRRAR